jgi:ankyrin repeat protein
MSKLLLDAGADINAKDKKGRTALQLASFFGNLDTVAVLLERGCDIESRDDKGTTALMSAVRRDHEVEITIDVVTRLLQSKAAIEAVDPREQTALHHAASVGKTPVVRHLLKGGANIEAKDGLGWTALHCASRRNNQSLVKLLLEKGADPKVQNNKGTAALQMAQHWKCDEVNAILSQWLGIPFQPSSPGETYFFEEV